MTQDKIFAAHVRRDMTDDEELRQSLKTFGWHPEFPAIADESGAVLVGNRRLRIAKEEGIAPIIKTINFGNGDEADAARIKLALISNLGSQPLSKDDRRRIAEHLYGEKGWTMQRIGEALGVSQRQISTDLSNLEVTSKIPREEKRGRKKAGRKTADVADRHERIIAFADAGMTAKEISQEVGVGERMVDRVLEVEGARREGLPPTINPDLLSKSAGEKIEAAIRAHKRMLDREFEVRVLDEVKKRVEEMSLPSLQRQLDDAQRVLKSRREGIMPRRIFNLIRSCLHTDSRKSVSDKKLNEAFNEFSIRERTMLTEKEDPTPELKFPRTWAEAQEWKRKVKEERKAKKQAMAHA